MKKIIIMLSTILVLFSAFSFAADQQVLDAERVAQCFAGNPIDSYSGSFGYTSEAKGFIFVQFEYKMNLDGEITYLACGDTVIVGEGDDPLPGLPEPNEEARYFSFYLEAMHDNVVVSYGTFYDQLHEPGEAIDVILQMPWRPEFVKYQLPDGVDSSIVLETPEGAYWEYSVANGGFNIWVDPIKKTAYKIWAPSTGIVYYRGEVDLIRQGAQPDKAVVSVSLPAGVVNVPPSQYCNYKMQKLDGVVLRDNNTVPAKVYIVDVQEKSMSIYAYGISGNIEVRRWTQTGEMPIMSSCGTGTGSDLYIQSGYNKLIVTVTGQITDTAGFWINFSTY